MKIKDKLFILGIVFILLISSVSAVCTVTFDKQPPTNYTPTTDISAAL